MTQGIYNEPHTQVILLHKHQHLIGASAASPTLVVKTENCLYIYIYVYIYICIYGTCVFRICIHPAPFVRDAIFPHCMLVHVTTVAQD